MIKNISPRIIPFIRLWLINRLIVLPYFIFPNAKYFSVPTTDLVQKITMYPNLNHKTAYLANTPHPDNPLAKIENAQPNSHLE